MIMTDDIFPDCYKHSNLLKLVKLYIIVSNKVTYLVISPCDEYFATLIVDDILVIIDDNAFV